MKNPRQALADARIRVVQLERYLTAARFAETDAEIELLRAEVAERAPTMRPPPTTTPDAVDAGWEP